jgi:KDO2-lipid IV(A) lauroyltransferase
MLEAMVVALFWAVLRLFGPDRAVDVVSRITSRVGPRFRKSKNVRANLAIMFPAAMQAERDAIERGMWGQAGALLADLAQMDVICAGNPNPRIEIVTKGSANVFARGGRAVFAATHLANPQISTWAAERLGVRVTAPYLPDSNPILDRMILRRRLAIGCDLIEREGGIRGLMRELERNRAVGFVVDTRFDAGDLVPFFGVEAPTITTPARLALHFGCELIPVQVERLGATARFRVTFHDPIRPSDPTLGKREQALDMTRQLNAHFEQWIRERPDQWFVEKRRWPKGEAAELDGERPPEHDAFVTDRISRSGMVRDGELGAFTVRSRPPGTSRPNRSGAPLHSGTSNGTPSTRVRPSS